MCVLIDHFVPNLYERYVTSNIKFTDGHKEYCSSIAGYMVNKPGTLVEYMLKKKDAFTAFMVAFVQRVYVCINILLLKASQQQPKKQIVIWSILVMMISFVFVSAKVLNVAFLQAFLCRV